jgi:hypothetical protein
VVLAESLDWALVFGCQEFLCQENFTKTLFTSENPVVYGQRGL